MGLGIFIALTNISKKLGLSSVRNLALAGCVVAIVWSPEAAVAQAGQTGERSNPENSATDRQVPDMTREFLAYKRKASGFMLSRVNTYVRRLQLDENVSVLEKDARVYVNRPGISGLGSVETEKYVYSFPGYDRKALTNQCGTEWFLEWGKLAYIIRRKPYSTPNSADNGDVEAIQRRLAGMPCLIDTNGAYRLATQWLAAVSVDVRALEKVHRPQCEQEYFYEGAASMLDASRAPQDDRIRKLPIFDVTWGGKADCDPPVWVKVNGTSKTLIHIRMEDTRFSTELPFAATNLARIEGILNSRKQNLNLNTKGPRSP